jgi:hypothetical protein
MWFATRLLRTGALIGCLAVVGCAAQPVPPGEPPADVEKMLDEIDAGRLKRTVETLAAFGTRHTLSDTTSDKREIGAARRWIEAELRRYAGDSAGPRTPFWP